MTLLQPGRAEKRTRDIAPRQAPRTQLQETPRQAEVAELADAADSKSVVLKRRVGSTPTFGTAENKLDSLPPDESGALENRARGQATGWERRLSRRAREQPLRSIGGACSAAGAANSRIGLPAPAGDPCRQAFVEGSGPRCLAGKPSSKVRAQRRLAGKAVLAKPDLGALPARPLSRGTKSRALPASLPQRIGPAAPCRQAFLKESDPRRLAGKPVVERSNLGALPARALSRGTKSRALPARNFRLD